MTITKEMQAALIADGEKLKQLTGQDHGPVFVSDDVTCDDCNGSGDCDNCCGEGEIDGEECEECRGGGMCPYCGGEGLVPAPRE